MHWCSAPGSRRSASVAGRRAIAAADGIGGARAAVAGKPRVRAMRAAVDVARADVLMAARWPNPRVTVDREPVAGVTEVMTMVSQPLPINGYRGLRYRPPTRWSTPVPAGRMMRCDGRGPTCGWLSRNWWPRKRASAN